MNPSPPNPVLRAINTLVNMRVHDLATRPQWPAALGIVASPLVIFFCFTQAATVSTAFHNAHLLLQALLLSTAIVATINFVLALEAIRPQPLRPPSYLLATLPPLSMVGAGTFFMVAQPNETYHLNEQMTDAMAYFSLAAAAWNAGHTIPFIPLDRQRQRAPVTPPPGP